jgi:hypothetical protein
MCRFDNLAGAVVDHELQGHAQSFRKSFAKVHGDAARLSRPKIPRGPKRGSGRTDGDADAQAACGSKLGAQGFPVCGAGPFVGCHGAPSCEGRLRSASLARL